MATISMKTRAEDTADVDVKKKTIFQVAPRAFVLEEGFNLRNYNDPEVEANIEGFAVSFETGKYVPPVLGWVRPDGSIGPIEGHCRALGAQRAVARNPDLQLMVAVEEFKGTKAERRAAMMRSDTGLKFKTIDVAMGFLDLSNEGVSNGDIAVIGKCTPARVEQLLLLARADADVHRMVREGHVDAEAAIALVRKARSDGADAAAVLKAELEAGKERGITKVTRATLKPWAPAPKIVANVLDSVQLAVARLDLQTRTDLVRFEAMPNELVEAELAGKTISIDAAALVALLKANAEVVAAKAVKDAKEAQAKSTLTQGGLLDSDTAAGTETAGDAVPANGADDPLYEAAVKVAAREMRTSASSLVAQLKVTLPRAERLLDALLENGVVTAVAETLTGERMVQPANG